MKKLIIALIAMFGITAGASAQKMDLSFSYGGYTVMDAANYHDGWHGVNNAWGAVTAAFNGKVLPKFSIGPSYTFSSASVKGHDNGHLYYHAIMLNGKYEYFKTPIVTLYGHLGIGAEITHLTHPAMDAYNKTYFAFQASPVGVDCKILPGFTLFGELGFGVQGLLQVGGRFNF